MALSTEWASIQEFEFEMLWAFDLMQNIILSLRTADEDLNYLRREIGSYRSKRPEIYEMRDLCNDCILGVLQALAVADELRFKHEQLFDFFAGPETFAAKPYDLAFQIQDLHGDLFSRILAIRMSLEDAEPQFRSLQKARKLQSRLRKVARCIRDLLTLAAPATAFIPYVGPLVGGLCGIGAGLAAIAHERIEPAQAFQFSNLRAAVQQTSYMRNTLGDIMLCQSVLSGTMNRALSLMADDDEMEGTLVLEQTTIRKPQYYFTM